MPPLLDPQTAAAHRSRLCAVAHRLCGSLPLAEDLTQETYARVLARPRRVRTDADFAYLVRTLHNVMHDHWRNEGRRPRVVGAVHEEHPCLDADRDPDAVAYWGDVHTAVADLPDEFRRVVTAVDVLGLSYAQAARTLRIPPGTVMSRLARGRSRVACALA